MRYMLLALLALAAWRIARRVRVVEPVFEPAPPVFGGVTGPFRLDIDHSKYPNDLPSALGYARPPHVDRLPRPRVGDALGGMVHEPSERIV